MSWGVGYCPLFATLLPFHIPLEPGQQALTGQQTEEIQSCFAWAVAPDVQRR